MGSVEATGGSVYVAYTNGTPNDGSSGASTIVQYSSSGGILNATTVAGHTDGLRYNPYTGLLWSLQNAAGASNLVLITPGTLAKSAPIAFPSINGGGFDDVAFLNGQALVSASNPTNNPNTSPALVTATLGSGGVTLAAVLAGNASATALNPGAPSTLNLQDPQSLSLTQDGKLVLSSRANGQLVYVTNPGTAAQTVGVRQLLNGVKVEDTAFAPAGASALLVADQATNTVYAVAGSFDANRPYSAALDWHSLGFVGAANPDGTYAPLLVGLGDPAGEAFLVSEPGTAGLLAAGFLALLVLCRRGAYRSIAIRLNSTGVVAMPPFARKK